MKHVVGTNSRTTLSGVQDGDVQPNACDLRLAKVLRILPNEFVIDNDSKTHRGSVVVEPDELGWYRLEPGSYEVVMENVVNVGSHEAGFVITRSTLNRNAVFLTSGLYDSMYHGMMAACMHVGAGIMHIKQGTRIGQYLSFDAEMLHHYNGSYGLNTEHDKKYGV